ncbi:uncharacterized protein B0H18DRAFT_960557 [Fomitopsis serialis]|uniref:uncharacterized protein n=1 Tax=Fomitopsis serialis TaxID=139415 RepID=UPI00200877C7|nr:uncharacterized protein B0H18DRAFT_960557 [Neoantrodia serialis]KAH9913191.1 hypothetical protein B0H18DRAFT_960557 [Neoantrodia serialis]
MVVSRPYDKPLCREAGPRALIARESVRWSAECTNWFFEDVKDVLQDEMSPISFSVLPITTRRRDIFEQTTHMAATCLTRQASPRRQRSPSMQSGGQGLRGKTFPGASSETAVVATGASRENDERSSSVFFHERSWIVGLVKRVCACDGRRGPDGARAPQVLCQIACRTTWQTSQQQQHRRLITVTRKMGLRLMYEQLGTHITAGLADGSAERDEDNGSLAINFELKGSAYSGNNQGISYTHNARSIYDERRAQVRASVKFRILSVRFSSPPRNELRRWYYSARLPSGGAGTEVGDERAETEGLWPIASSVEIDVLSKQNTGLAVAEDKPVAINRMSGVQSILETLGSTILRKGLHAWMYVTQPATCNTAHVGWIPLRDGPVTSQTRYVSTWRDVMSNPHRDPKLRLGSDVRVFERTHRSREYQQSSYSIETAQTSGANHDKCHGLSTVSDCRTTTSHRTSSTLMSPRIPRCLVWIRPTDNKFSAAYHGANTRKWRPAVVSKIDVLKSGHIAGFWVAPLTSSLNLKLCDATAWRAVDWGRPDIAVPGHSYTIPFRLPLRQNDSFGAVASHVWVSDLGQFFTVAQWKQAVTGGQARILDSDVAVSSTQFAAVRTQLRVLDDASGGQYSLCRELLSTLACNVAELDSYRRGASIMHAMEDLSLSAPAAKSTNSITSDIVLRFIPGLRHLRTAYLPSSFASITLRRTPSMVGQSSIRDLRLHVFNLSPIGRDAIRPRNEILNNAKFFSDCPPAPYAWDDEALLCIDRLLWSSYNSPLKWRSYEQFVRCHILTPPWLLSLRRSEKEEEFPHLLLALFQWITADAIIPPDIHTLKDFLCDYKELTPRRIRSGAGHVEYEESCSAIAIFWMLNNRVAYFNDPVGLITLLVNGPLRLRNDDEYSDDDQAMGDISDDFSD